jgi:23S rRNA pseudouridine1911/1915/1917 synthase
MGVVSVSSFWRFLEGLRMVRPGLRVLFEDNHLLVVDKPPGLATMGTGDSDSVHGLACEYIRRKYNKPGKVYLGVVHRLDSMTSGALVLARTSKAAARLSEQFRRAVSGPGKSYLAVLDSDCGGLARRGTLADRIVKNERAHRMEIAQADVSAGSGLADSGVYVSRDRKAGDGGQGESVPALAVLDYERIGAAGRGLTLVRVELKTGRKHQIRAQFAHRGWPVWGDVKYGAKRRAVVGIALHAVRLSITHPTAKTEMTFVSPVPKAWSEWFPERERWPES